MTSKRTLEVHLGDEFTNAVGGLPNKNVSQAVGYLVLWAIGNDRYRSVEICGDRTGDIEATYRNEGGTITYGMLAQKREDGSYSVHS
jgi:hypothetical protein